MPAQALQLVKTPAIEGVFLFGLAGEWKPPDETRRLRVYFCLGSPASGSHWADCHQKSWNHISGYLQTIPIPCTSCGKCL